MSKNFSVINSLVNRFFSRFSAILIKPAENMKGNRLTVFILIAMVLGILVGYFVHRSSSPESIQKFASNIKLLTTIFLRLVQMIIAPLFLLPLLWALQNLAI